MKGVHTVCYAAVVLAVAAACSSFTSADSCDNLAPPLASHFLRYQFETSTNETWRQEVLAQLQRRRHNGPHLTHTDEDTWAGLLPRKALRKPDDEYNWDMIYRMIKHSSKDSKPPVGVLKEVSLHDVALDPDSVHGRAQQTNLNYLLTLDVDRLVWSFRNNSGLPSPGTPYGGWEDPTIELRGHFVGHYLSATAHMWASTQNDTVKARMDAVVAALAECQEKMQSGYLAAFPESFFDRFEAAQKVWAPYYTVHKIMAGLLDQYMLADDARALKMVSAMADYFYNRVQSLIAKQGIERHWASLVDEVGGMNDVLYRLYAQTGDEKHLTLAGLFEKPCFLAPLAARTDKLAGYHANTHLAVVVGINTGYEVVGDPHFKVTHRIADFFWVKVGGSFLTVTEKWNSGDTLTLELPMAPRLEALQDDRPEFAITQAVLFGPYLLAGLTEDDWAIKTGSGSVSDWLKPIPPSYNSHLIALTQAPNATQLALARAGGSVIMSELPGPGTNGSVHATFRLIVQGQDPSQPLASPKQALGKQVTIEPFDLPGTLLVHQGKEMSLTIAGAAGAGNASVFRLVRGLDGATETVSLESDSLTGCYVYSGSVEGVKLSCLLGDDISKKAASFVMRSGVSQYHDISFAATGPKRNYVMQPLQSLVDEFYNVYFDIQP
uniref:Non-reducing end beta-L-arabinofuranosidase-like GH127 catalytic domain-containing protein n=1 Tax=Kalanchoe fedtschenkoi TaxID=63787 RepID=A0A7N0VF04_KALFE